MAGKVGFGQILPFSRTGRVPTQQPRRGMLTGMGNLVPVTLVVGEEEFLVDRAVRAAVAQAREALAEDGGAARGTCTTWRRPRSARGNWPRSPRRACSAAARW